MLNHTQVGKNENNVAEGPVGRKAAESKRQVYVAGRWCCYYSLHKSLKALVPSGGEAREENQVRNGWKVLSKTRGRNSKCRRGSVLEPPGTIAPALIAEVGVGHLSLHGSTETGMCCCQQPPHYTSALGSCALSSQKEPNIPVYFLHVIHRQSPSRCAHKPLFQPLGLPQDILKTFASGHPEDLSWQIYLLPQATFKIP